MRKCKTILMMILRRISGIEILGSYETECGHSAIIGINNVPYLIIIAPIDPEERTEEKAMQSFPSLN